MIKDLETKHIYILILLWTKNNIYKLYLHSDKYSSKDPYTVVYHIEGNHILSVQFSLQHCSKHDIFSADLFNYPLFIYLYIHIYTYINLYIHIYIYIYNTKDFENRQRSDQAINDHFYK